jgi:F420-non-reducing hydrogenase small subunit
VKIADIVFWPVAIDVKYKDVEAMPDKYIDICFFNGSIRTGEQEHMAKLLRQKSKTLVAFGSCAQEGCIPGLANLYDRKEIFDKVYLESKSIANPKRIVPKTTTEAKEGTLKRLPTSSQTHSNRRGSHREQPATAKGFSACTVEICLRRMPTKEG